MLGHRLHEVELFLANTIIAQYFKYFGYGHQAYTCRNRTACGACGEQHERRAYSIPENLLKPKYCNCQGSHPAWASICPVYQEVAKRAREAWISHPEKYKIPISTSLTPVPQSPATSFSFSQPLTEGKKHKTAEPTRSLERIRGSCPEVQILGARSTNNEEKVSANSFKIFEDEMST